MLCSVQWCLTVCAGVWWCVEMSGFPCPQSVRTVFPIRGAVPSTTKDIPSHSTTPHETTQQNTTKDRDTTTHATPLQCLSRPLWPSLTDLHLSAPPTTTTNGTSKEWNETMEMKRRTTQQWLMGFIQSLSRALSTELQQRRPITGRGWMKGTKGEGEAEEANNGEEGIKKKEGL